MLLTLATLAVLAQGPQKCLTVGGNRVCGYECAENGVRAQCTQTPAGVCAKNSTQVMCFDPPLWLAALWGGSSVPKPVCESDGTSISSNNQVACARTPFGICAEGGGVPTCFDPHKNVICAKGATTAKAQCVRQSGSVFCGYQCARAGDEVACAKTPDGSCDTSGPGKPVCFDPPMRGGSSACLEATCAR